MFRPTFSMKGLEKAISSELDRMKRHVSGVIAQNTEGLKLSLRAQTTQVLGAGVGKAWRSEVFPDKPSLNAAGWVETKAPKIINFNQSAPVVTPIFGRYLAIPTENVPRGANRKPMTKEQVEARFGKLRVFRGRRGNLVGMVKAIAALNGRGWRPPTKRRIKTRPVEMVHMFTFVPSVRGRRLIDTKATFQRWASRTAHDLKHIR